MKHSPKMDVPSRSVDVGVAQTYVPGVQTAVAESREFDVRSGDGRVVHVYDDGDPAGPLLVYHHGTPLSGLLPTFWAQVAQAEGVRLVSFDRAGYGGSERRPGRRIADVVADTEAVADALGAERFFVFGESGGGSYALGCAALLPARVVAAVSMSGPAPFDAEGLDFMAGMGQLNIDEFNAALAGERSLRTFLSEQREALLATNPQTMHEMLESVLSPVDKVVLTGDLVEWVHAASIRGLEPGCDGWLDDDVSTVRPWGFDLSNIRVPVLIQAGEQDRLCLTPTHTGSSTIFLRRRMHCRPTTATSPFSQTSSAPCAGSAATTQPSTRVT